MNAFIPVSLKMPEKVMPFVEQRANIYDMYSCKFNYRFLFTSKTMVDDRPFA